MTKADICLLVEGSYPYVRGGVSSWVQDLITSQKDYTFSVVSILPYDEEPKSLYPRPKNLISVTRCSLSSMPEGSKSLTRPQQKILSDIERKIIAFMTKAGVDDLKEFLPLLKGLGNACGSHALLNSPAAWELLVESYRKLMPQSSFLDYFWSFRALLEGFYSALLFDIPPAKLYHATCTGYAGFLGARCRLETGRPLLLTEHGIYTNERRVELLSAAWLYRTIYSRSYGVNRTIRELRDLWIGTFTNYSRICYEACDKIITLYEDNQAAQAMDGATPDKMMIIPNGVDYEYFSSIERYQGPDRPPVIAFIGRVVPIKDVKTFIRACGLLKDMLPDLSVYIMGPYEEDPAYYEECCDMIDHMRLAGCVAFTGNVNIMDYLPRVDVIVLTSISEAQPLVILEAGAAGIPIVATRVGACHEIIMGKKDESPPLGEGGVIVPLSNPVETAKALHRLLTDVEFCRRCSRAIRERVQRYYHKNDQHRVYRELYGSFLNSSSPRRGEVRRGA